MDLEQNTLVSTQIVLLTLKAVATGKSSLALLGWVGPFFQLNVQLNGPSPINKNHSYIHYSNQ